MKSPFTRVLMSTLISKSALPSPFNEKARSLNGAGPCRCPLSKFYCAGVEKVSCAFMMLASGSFMNSALAAALPKQ